MVAATCEKSNYVPDQTHGNMIDACFSYQGHSPISNDPLRAVNDLSHLITLQKWSPPRRCYVMPATVSGRRSSSAARALHRQYFSIALNAIARSSHELVEYIAFRHNAWLYGTRPRTSKSKSTTSSPSRIAVLFSGTASQ
jgi:hypothetical protein